MAIVVVGSVAFDTLKTPTGSRERELGGAATHFSLAASFFTGVRVIGIVGDDFTAQHEAVMTNRGVDTSGIQRIKGGKSFHWSGEYGENVNEARTLATDLNVFADFNPQVPPDWRKEDYLFLANIDPALQYNVRTQMNGTRMVGCDTMNFWIGGKPDDLARLLKRVDILLVNDGEAKQLAGEPSLPCAARKILTKGPKAVVIKHGEFGATAFFSPEASELGTHPFRAPALPIEEVIDPTGAGDSFAGGFFGYIASQPILNREVFKRAMFYGSVMGSFCVERFGTERIQALTRDEIEARFGIFRELTHLD